MAKKDKKNKKNKIEKITFLDAATKFSGAATKFQKVESFILPNKMTLDIFCGESKNDTITLDGNKVNKAVLRLLMYRLHVIFHGDDKEWKGTGPHLKITVPVQKFFELNKEWCAAKGITTTKAKEKPVKAKGGKTVEDKPTRAKSLKTPFSEEELETVVKKKAAKQLLDGMQIGGDQIDEIIDTAFDGGKKQPLLVLIQSVVDVVGMTKKEMKKAFAPII